MARMSAKERKLAETLADPIVWGQAYLRNRFLGAADDRDGGYLKLEG